MCVGRTSYQVKAKFNNMCEKCIKFWRLSTAKQTYHVYWLRAIEWYKIIKAIIYSQSRKYSYFFKFVFHYKKTWVLSMQIYKWNKNSFTMITMILHNSFRFKWERNISTWCRLFCFYLFCYILEHEMNVKVHYMSMYLNI